MTLLEKIKNYKWFDSPNKLRTILEELYNSIGGGSGGGTQDLQSVLDNGSFGSIVSQYDPLEEYTSLNMNEYVALINSKKFETEGQLLVTNGTVSIRQFYDLITEPKVTILEFETPVSNTTIKVPSKSLGIYTLATLDDIKKIDLSDRIYANNTAAISGGLTANDVYRTSTGELRIVV